jgi:colicin import membrane protein
MHTSTLTRPTDRPPRQEAWGVGTAMSVLAHALLVAALVWGVHWHSKAEPEGTSAELWSAVPQISAPPPPQVEPPPPPPPPRPAPVEPAPPPVTPTVRPPDIVTEQDKQKKAREEEQKKEAAEKAAAQKAAEEKAAQDKAKADAEKQKKLDEQKLAKLRQDQLARITSQLGGPPDSTGTAARNAGPSASYLGRVTAILKRNLTQLDPVPGNPVVEFEIRCAPDGTIISRRITKSSGSQAWDDAVLRAIDKTAVLPRDTDGKAPSSIPFRWRQSDAQ